MTNHFLYQLDPDKIAFERKKIPFSGNTITELSAGGGFGFAKAIILEKETNGRYLFLPQVDFLFFMLYLDHIPKMRKGPLPYHWELSHMDQCYRLNFTLEKDQKTHKKVLTIEDHYTKATVSFSLSYFQTITKTAKVQVWNDYKLLYPEIKECSDFPEYDYKIAQD